MVDDVAQGRADIGISKLSQTYYRLIRVRFSEPYITLSHALLFERAAVSSGNYEPRQLLLEAQSVSMSIGTAIAVMPTRVKAFRRDILSVIVVLPFLSFDGLAAASLLPTLSKSLETASLTIFRVATGLTLIWIKPVGMSALGQKQTFAVQKGMSALPPKADIVWQLWHVRFVPIADISNSG